LVRQPASTSTQEDENVRNEIARTEEKDREPHAQHQTESAPDAREAALNVRNWSFWRLSGKIKLALLNFDQLSLWLNPVVSSPNQTASGEFY